MQTLAFQVSGDPVTEGSVVAMPFFAPCSHCKPGKVCGRRFCWHGKIPRANVVHEDRDGLGTWRTLVKVAAVSALAVAQWRGRPAFPAGEPVAIAVVFDLVRPGGHWTSTGALSAEGRRVPAPTKEHSGDVDKLIRAVCDSLAGVVYETDAQVALKLGGKRWAQGRPKEGGAHLVITSAVSLVPALREIVAGFTSTLEAGTNLELIP